MGRWLAVAALCISPFAGSLSAATAATFVAGGLTALPETISGPNLLTNAGFEAVPGRFPGAWDAASGWAA